MTARQIIVAFLCLFAAAAGWNLWHRGRRHQRLADFFAYLIGIALGFAIAYAAYDTVE
jgi:hypothetical protein